MSKKADWIVRVKATVTKEIVCKNCTLEEAEENPFKFAEWSELETEQTDYDVISVEEDR